MSHYQWRAGVGLEAEGFESDILTARSRFCSGGRVGAPAGYGFVTACLETGCIPVKPEQSQLEKA